jgi:UDP-N-acetylglucosamine transferase subunit ALG13
LRTDFNIKILVAPLDWGLGHACRCIPIIRHLSAIGCTVILAANSPQKSVLQTEFPDLLILELGGYNITYAKTKRWFSFRIFSQLPKILSAINKEHEWLKTIVSKHRIDAVISDNRYGLWHSQIPVAFITHQLNIEAPFSWSKAIIRKFNYKFINRFSCCWVPDVEGIPNIAGKLSHPKQLPRTPVKYMGGISRFEKQTAKEEYDALIVISGPEPQRTLFEEKILKDLENFRGKILLVRGLPGNASIIPSTNNAEIVNHLTSNELAIAFCKAKYIISRSGYTTVMDILKLNKKSILIPTPGQTEQEYLGAHLQKQYWCMIVNQNNFNLKQALTDANAFDYKRAGINMEIYKQVLNDFVAEVEKQKQNKF